MNFTTYFLRKLGTGGPNAPLNLANIPLLAGTSDVAPTASFGVNGTRPAPVPGGFSYATAIPTGTTDSLVVMRAKNKDTIPNRRLAVALNATAAAVNLTCNFFVWDEGTQQWYLVNAAAAPATVTLVPQGVVYLDIPVISEVTSATQRYGGTGQNFQPPQGDSGDIIVMCVPTTAVGQPANSMFQISMGPCMATSQGK